MSEPIENESESDLLQENLAAVSTDLVALAKRLPALRAAVEAHQAALREAEAELRGETTRLQSLRNQQNDLLRRTTGLT